VQVSNCVRYLYGGRGQIYRTKVVSHGRNRASERKKAAWRVQAIRLLVSTLGYIKVVEKGKKHPFRETQVNPGNLSE